MLHISMPITLNFPTYTVGLSATLKWEWWMVYFSLSNGGQKHMWPRLRNNTLRLMTKVKNKLKKATPSPPHINRWQMATLNLIRLSPNHRNKKTRRSGFYGGYTGLTALITLFLKQIWSSITRAKVISRLWSKLLLMPSWWQSRLK